MNKWLIIDTHNQFMPKEAVDKEQAINKGLRNSAAATPGRLAALPGWIADLENRLRVMDDAGIDMAVIHQAPRSSLGLDFCRSINEGNARVAKQYPGRFIPCAHLPLDGGGGPEALNELVRAVNGLGLKGLALETSTERVTLDSEELFPLYEKVSRLNIPIVIHPTIREPIWGGVKYDMSSGISREYEITKACVEVMYGVLNRFPDLKFLMPHHGGALPIWKGRMLMSFIPDGYEIPENIKNNPRPPRVRRQLGLDSAFDAVFDKLYFDTAGFQGWMPITQATLSIVKPDRVCFGTDYPFEVHEAQDIKAFIDNIKKLNISETDKRNILGENARNLFKVDS